MEAFVLEDRNIARIKDIDEPTLSSEGSAILTPIAVSMCTSDVNTVYGTGSKKPSDLVLGHEAVARVVEVGYGVKSIKVGDIVVCPAITPDFSNPEIEDCNFLHAGAPFSSNALSRSIPGVFARKFELKFADMNLALLPEGVSIEDALMCTDMVTTGFSGAEYVNFGDNVVVLGIGAVGLMAIAGCRLRGAGRIIAVGTRQASIGLAKEFGANEVISYRDTDIVSYVKAETKTGADIVIVAGGNDETFTQAVDMVRYGVGKVVNLKHYSGDGNIPLPKFGGGRGMAGKTIYLELGKGGRVRMERLLRLVKYQGFSPARIITHRFKGFENIPKTLELMRDKGDNVIKTMVETGW